MTYTGLCVSQAFPNNILYNVVQQKTQYSVINKPLQPITLYLDDGYVLLKQEKYYL